MDKLAVEYSGMNLGVLALWIFVLTLAGFAARKIVRGRSLLGFLGDATFGLLGVFLVGTLLKAFEMSLTTWIASFDLGPLKLQPAELAKATVLLALALLLYAQWGDDHPCANQPSGTIFEVTFNANAN